MKPGDLVRHERAPAWGVGVVVEARGDLVRINFENHKAATIKTSAAGAELVPVDVADIEADSPLLDADRWHEYDAPPEERTKPTARPRCRHCNEPLNRARKSHDLKLKSCPRCSASNGDEHVFFESPAAFGTSDKRASGESPDGVQSHCIACRTNTTSAFPMTSCAEVEFRPRSNRSAP